MHSPSRLSRRALVAATLLGLLVASASAQDYPQRPVSIVVTLPPGSTVDVLARAFGQQLSQRLKQSVVVENKPGAGLMLGMQNVAAAPADGHMLAFTPVTPLTIQPHRTKTSYAMDSFVPLCQTFENVFFLAVPSSSPHTSAKGVLEHLKAQPGKLRYGHSGTGSAPHLMAEEMWRSLGVSATDVPYRGETAFGPDLMAGVLDAGMVTTSMLQQLKFRPLAVFAPERSKAFPDVPTTAELGAKVLPSAYGGLFVRAGTAPEVVSRLEGLCKDIVATPAYQKQAETLQQNATYLDRDAFARRLTDDAQAKGKLLSQLKLRD
ncbi:Bug family tripartite tricarboxylate transporter substrate binding protein [Ramlibacter rhizophilus]|nr:tripartite tricarboxylate transporter substrate binding protein [Ramlibacter rhizophilus]